MPLVIFFLLVIISPFAIIIQSSSAGSGEDSTLTGYIWDIAEDAPAQDYNVEIEGENYLGNATTTTATGFYEINITPGEHTLEISNSGRTYLTKQFTIDRGETKRLDFRIDSSPEEDEEEDIFSLNLDELSSNVVDHWYASIVLLILIIIIPIILVLLSRFFIKVRAEQRKYDEKSMEFFEIIIKYNIYLILAILVLWVLALVFPKFEEHVWDYFVRHLHEIYSILILFIMMKLFLLILNRGIGYLRGDHSTKPGRSISPRYIGALEIILKYLIILFFGINIIIMLLAIFGMGDVIYDVFGTFLADNSGYFIFMIVVIFIVYIVLRFVNTLVDDVKRREAPKFSPQVADMAGNVFKGIVLIMGAVLIIFALLQMANMGELGTTIIMMISIIIGFVVAMAATGSIGNILSGLLLSGFRPFAEGDRVQVGAVIGDVKDMNLAFVRLRTLNNEQVDIPNNTVIGDKIINYSKSGAFAINADVSIGYTTPSTLVRKLLIDAARETKDILDEPRPHVILIEMKDYAIVYKLRAYTENAKAMLRVRSTLMANIQHKFYSRGVEILSPWYMVRREERELTDEQIAASWESIDKRGREILEKETVEKMGDGFELMDKMISSGKTSKK